VSRKKIGYPQAFPRVVIDTNILVSGIISKEGPTVAILDEWQKGKFVVVSSLKIIKEIVRVLHYPKIEKAKAIRKKEIRELVTTLLRFAVIVPGKLKIEVIEEDPEDNKFLEAAIEGQAGYILSGDKHLLGLQEFKEIKILTAKEFLDQILKGK
jgi:putative PIN family toxin of toxin-antitoxin system